MKYVIYMLRRERWDIPLGAAVGITLQSYVRHHPTNSDGLYRIPGLTHEEAGLIVRDEVKAIIARWGPTIGMRPAMTARTGNCRETRLGSTLRGVLPLFD